MSAPHIKSIHCKYTRYSCLVFNIVCYSTDSQWILLQRTYAYSSIHIFNGSFLIRKGPILWSVSDAKYLTTTTLATEDTSVRECQDLCVNTEGCRSLDYQETSPRCSLKSASFLEMTLQAGSGVVHYEYLRATTGRYQKLRPLTTLNKMSDILQTISPMPFPECKLRCLIQTRASLKAKVTKKSVVQVMVWCEICDKPIAEMNRTQVIGTCMHHQVSVS